MATIDALITQPKTHEWSTPPEFFDGLDAEFGFTLDAAATAANAKCDLFYDAYGLDLPWPGVVWVNCPYGSEIGKWVRKGYEESQKGSTVVMLIPARTETAYWHDYVMRAHEIRIVRGRLRFSGITVNAPFPSAVIIFRQGRHIPVLRAIGRDGTT